MSHIPPIGQSPVEPVNRANAPSAPAAGTGGNHSAGTRSADRVEVSSHARLLERLGRLPDYRSELVERVRREIAEGTYETDDKLRTAVDRLLDDLAG